METGPADKETGSPMLEDVRIRLVIRSELGYLSASIRGHR